MLSSFFIKIKPIVEYKPVNRLNLEGSKNHVTIVIPIMATLMHLRHCKGNVFSTICNN